MLDYLTFFTLFSGIGLALVYDLKTRLIPNELSYSLFTFAILLSAMNGSLLMGLYSVCLMTTACGFFYVIGRMGGGDIKLLIGIAPLFDVVMILKILVSLVVIGAIYAVFVVAVLLITRTAGQFGITSGGNSGNGFQQLGFYKVPFVPVILASVLWALFLPMSELIPGG